MKEFILIVCKPALLLCLLGFCVLGCECIPTTFPRTEPVVMYLKNMSDNPIHMFVDVEGTGFDPGNKVEPGKQRQITFDAGFDDENSFKDYLVTAGRDGTALDTKYYNVKPTAKWHYITVTWDGWGLY